MTDRAFRSPQTLEDWLIQAVLAVRSAAGHEVRRRPVEGRTLDLAHLDICRWRERDLGLNLIFFDDLVGSFTCMLRHFEPSPRSPGGTRALLCHSLLVGLLGVVWTCTRSLRGNCRRGAGERRGS
eukprot:766853-Hanusia_phi.AAC.5